jgi:hypothetical protein
MAVKESIPVQKEDVVLQGRLALAVTIGVLVMALPKPPRAFGVPGRADAAAQKSVIAIPQSLEAEHHEIHEALLEATRFPGASWRGRKGARGSARPAFRA